MCAGVGCGVWGVGVRAPCVWLGERAYFSPCMVYAVYDEGVSVSMNLNEIHSLTLALSISPRICTCSARMFSAIRAAALFNQNLIDLNNYV